MFLSSAMLLAVTLFAAPFDASRAGSEAQAIPLLGEPMLVCDGGNKQSCEMRCLQKFKMCHRGDQSKIEACRADVLDPCNQACDEQCG